MVSRELVLLYSIILPIVCWLSRSGSTGFIMGPSLPKQESAFSFLEEDASGVLFAVRYSVMCSEELFDLMVSFDDIATILLISLLKTPQFNFNA